MPTAKENLARLGFDLSRGSAPVANYVPYALSGNLLFIAGQISRNQDGTPLVGVVGESLTIDAGYAAARSAALGAIGVMNDALGDLERVTRVVRVVAMVNSTPGFTEHPAVANGASDLFVVVFENRGRHARSAIGVSSLPLGTAIEIEATVEIAG